MACQVHVNPIPDGFGFFRDEAAAKRRVRAHCRHSTVVRIISLSFQPMVLTGYNILLLANAVRRL